MGKKAPARGNCGKSIIARAPRYVLTHLYVFSLTFQVTGHSWRALWETPGAPRLPRRTMERGNHSEDVPSTRKVAPRRAVLPGDTLIPERPLSGHEANVGTVRVCAGVRGARV